MNEKLLHYIWRYRLFQQQGLTTTEGEKVAVVNPGTYNTDAGPDFQNAKVRIGSTLWAGNVELHIDGADWKAHKHHEDESYNNVILHVVYEDRKSTALRKDASEIPALNLKPFINPGMLSRYEELSKKKTWIPCAKFFKDVDESVLTNFLERLAIERLENKVEMVNKLLADSENDWENVMFQMLARYFGAGVNKEPFLALANILPVKTWAKHQHESLQTEALVFGQAGFLTEKFTDDYPNQLRKEYNYLKRLYQLRPLQKHEWKFLRLRPSNFPTVRLAQLAALMGKEVKLFSRILETKSAKAIHGFFDVEVSGYWKEHYQFDKLSKRVNSHLGKAMKDTLLVNAVAPVLFAYGKYKGTSAYCDRALDLLDACPAEGNSIINGWKTLGLKPKTAFNTQSLIQLKNEYCDKFRCLDCAVGHSVLKPA